jgi:hypothetical protein
MVSGVAAYVMHGVITLGDDVVLAVKCIATNIKQ